MCPLDSGSVYVARASVIAWGYRPLLSSLLLVLVVAVGFSVISGPCAPSGGPPKSVDGLLRCLIDLALCLALTLKAGEGLGHRVFIWAGLGTTLLAVVFDQDASLGHSLSVRG